MSRDRQSQPPTHKDEQQVLNWSFDEKYKVLATELLAENSDGNALSRVSLDADGNLPVSQRDFDYIGVSNDGNTDTLTFKTGGAGGSTVRTLAITFAEGASKISDDITSLEFS